MREIWNVFWSARVWPLILLCGSGQLFAASRTYTNPVYAGSMPDPSVIRYKDAYYAFGTTGSERLSDGRIFTLLRSTNLVDWQKLGGALEPPLQNRRVQYWAPEITINDAVDEKGALRTLDQR